MKKQTLSTFLKNICSAAVVLSVILSLVGGFLPLKAYAYEAVNEEEKLYYGYNVTSGKSLSEPDALQPISPIIDPQSNYKDYIKQFAGTKQESQSYVSSSLSELTSEFARDISANIFGKIYEVDANVSSSFDLSKRSTDIYAEQYELYSTSIVRYYYIVQLETGQIRKYLSSQFVEDLSSVKSEEDAKNLFSKYGTHLITGFSFGGRLNITNYKTSSDTNQDFSQSMALSEKMAAVISLVQAGESASIAETYGTIENDATSTSTYKFVSYGGEATSSLTLDGLFTYNPSYTDGDKAGFMYTRWINSINADQNLAIIGIPNGAQSIPLWDLLDNTIDTNEIRSYLLNAYMDMCGDKYDDYLSQYPPIVREVSIDDVNAALPKLNGAYIETENGYFYYVDQNDFSADGNHFGIKTGDYIYLDLELYSDSGNMSYSIQNGTEINAKSAIFQVTGTSGTFELKITCEDKTAKLISVPILQNPFEGGMGNENYPYILASTEQFLNISSDPGASYLLVNDLDFANTTISGINNFSGILDGNYCKLSNFSILSSRSWGLFTSNAGTIKNLIIENAGTSTSEAGFTAGGNDYAKDDYTKNSIHSLDAGIVCGNNTGIIENCLLRNVYIRNIISDPNEYLVNESIAIRTGAAVGVNSGTINNCMVTEARILGGYMLDGDNNEFNISVYSGGLVGELKGGSISSCVVDSGINGSVFSQSINPYKVSANAVNEVFATMFVGYCNSKAQIENSYVYVRNTSSANSQKAVDVDLVFGSRFVLWNNKPDNYYALRGAFMVTGDECEITGSCINSYSADTGIKYYGITPTKNGSNNDGSTNTFKKADGVEVEERKVSGESDIKNMGLSDTTYICNRNSTACIKHYLADSRNSYMTIGIDVAETQMKTDYYVDGYFTPVGLRVIRSLGSMNEEANVFTISIKGQPYSFPETGLTVTEEKAYNVEISMYNGEVSADKIPLVVSENTISSIYVNNGNYSSYYDDIHQYYTDFNLETVDLQAVLTGGESVDISENMALFKNADVDIKTLEDSIVAGENLVTIQFVYEDGTFEASFILNVEERRVKELNILTLPTKTEYNPGEAVSLSGMRVELVYNVGDSKILQTDEDLSRLEITGETVGTGRNIVFVSYDLYSNAASFEVTGNAMAPTMQEDPQSLAVSQEENSNANTNESQESNIEDNSISDDSQGGNTTLVLVISIVSVCVVAIVALMIIRRERTTSSHTENTNISNPDRKDHKDTLE